MTALRVAVTAPRGPLISLVCLCMNQWYTTTVFLTIVFVGARCVFNETETTDVFWGQEGVCSEGLQRSTIKKTKKKQRGKKKKRCVVVNLSLDVLSKMHTRLENVCGCIIGLSAEAEN